MRPGLRPCAEQFGLLPMPVLTVLRCFHFRPKTGSAPGRSEVSDAPAQAYIEADLAELHKNDVRVKIIGKRQGLDAQLVKLIEHAEQVTAANTACGCRLL